MPTLDIEEVLSCEYQLITRGLFMIIKLSQVTRNGQQAALVVFRLLPSMCTRSEERRSPLKKVIEKSLGTNS